jgi:hypothetical protein
MATTGSGNESGVVPDSVSRQRESLLRLAKSGDKQAIPTLFKQFLAVDEQIAAADYLGVQGLWGIGTSSFACVTSRRTAGVRVKIFGEVTYQDGGA